MNDAGGRTTGLDEVPTRLMSILTPPLWLRPAAAVASAAAGAADDSTPSSASTGAGGRSEPVDCTTSAWFPEDDTV